MSKALPNKSKIEKKRGVKSKNITRNFSVWSENKPKFSKKNNISKKQSSFFIFARELKNIKKYLFFQFRRATQKRIKPESKEVGQYKELVLPLYFGWEIVVRRRLDWKTHIITPFKTYWQYITAVLLFITLSSLGLWLYKYNIINAATYNFVQTDWSTGVTANNANHTSNRTGWTEYISKDSNITAGNEITISEAITTLTETSDTDFNAGTTSTAAISGSGDASYVALDVSSGSNGLINSAAGSEYALDVEVVGNYAYVANGAGGLFIYDVTDPANPSYVGDVDNGMAEKVAIYGNYAYVADTAHLDVINISVKASPTVGTPVAFTGGPSAVFVSGVYLYVAFDRGDEYTADGWIRIFSLADPAAPSQTAVSANQSHFINDIYVIGNYLYASENFWDAGYWSLDWYNISNPSAVTPVGDTAGTNEYTYGLAVSGQYVFLANWLDGIHVFSTSTDSRVHTYNTPGNAKELAINGDHLYVAENNSSVLDLNISNPLSISQNTTYSVTSAQDVYFSGSYLYVADYSSGLRTIAVPSYVSSGTFTSQVLDTTANSGYGNISWNSTLPSGTAITMKVRTDSNSNMSGATAWASCNTITSGSDISSHNCVTDGHRYVQYQATLTTTEASRTPQLADLSIQYNSYTSGSLLGSAFNTEDAANVMGTIAWTESGSGDVQLQVRTAPDSSGSPDWANGSAWCGPSNCAVTKGDSDYAASYYTTSGASIHNSQKTGANDQWYQYRLWLTSADGVSTPTFSDITVSYVVNAPPNFENTITATQGSDGLVTINYSIRDIDTSTGSLTPGFVAPSFQYSLDNGNNWNNITTGLSANATAAKAVGESAYASYQVTWTARNQINAYTTQAKIRVVINDGEAANNLASSDSVFFTMDAKVPTVGDPAVHVIASTTPASLVLSAADDTTLQMCITLDNSESNCISYDTSSTLSLATNPDTAYVKFRDAYSNITSASAVTPETPANMIIRDLSNTSEALTTPEYRLFVSWAAVSTPLVDFARYEVWHSADGSTYSLLSSIADKTINYYLHDDLVADSTHYYKVYTVDNDGNTSYFSSVVSDSANGQGGTDASPPTISDNVSVGSITTQSAVVTWTTDELSDSTVGYSTSAGNFNTETGVASMVTSHSVTLTGLTPDITYYLRVKSDDPDSNEGLDSNGGDGYLFATLDGPAISNTSASIVQNTTATITWNTDEASNSAVYYSTSANLSGAMSASDSASVMGHSVTISDLTAGTRYYFYVTSGVAVDNNGGEYYYFNTTSDSTGPIITDVGTSLVTDNKAVVTWLTDEGANSKVSYGTLTGIYTSSTIASATYDFKHSVNLSSLVNNTIHHYVVVSADSAGNISTSTESSFTTLEKLSTESEVIAREEAAADAAVPSCNCGGGGGSSIDRTPPILSNVKASPSLTGVKVSWDTDKEAVTIVSYGIKAVGEQSITNPDTLNTKVRKHELALSKLLPDTTYKYKAVSIDASGNIGSSAEGTFNSGEILDELASGEDKTFSDEANKESVNNTVDLVTEYFKKLSGAVSISTLENSVNKLFTNIVDLVPPPIISGEPTLTIGPDEVSVSWRTEDEASALVSYASEQYYVVNNKYQYTTGDPSTYLAGIHKVIVTGLKPETTYHYSIISKKSVGSTAESRDFVFTTLSESAEIENYTTEIISPEEVNFKWITTVATDSSIKYIPYRDGKLELDDARAKSNEVFTTIHNMTVNDLEAGVIYQVELAGQTVSGKNINQIISSFVTSDNNLAPIVKQVKTDTALSLGKETKVQAIISWQTNEVSTSQVYYEQGAGKAEDILTKSSLKDENLSRNHVVVITDFNPGTIYRFQVESVDGGGNVSRSRTYTILTPKQQESVFQVIMKNVEATFGWLQVFR